MPCCSGRGRAERRERNSTGLLAFPASLAVDVALSSTGALCRGVITALRGDAEDGWAEVGAPPSDNPAALHAHVTSKLPAAAPGWAQAGGAALPPCGSPSPSSTYDPSRRGACFQLKELLPALGMRSAAPHRRPQAPPCRLLEVPAGHGPRAWAHAEPRPRRSDAGRGLQRVRGAEAHQRWGRCAGATTLHCFLYITPAGMFR